MVVAVCGVTILFAGCRKKALDSSQLRAITYELVASAQTVTRHNSEIAIRPEVNPSSRGALAADDIYITLSDPGQRAALEQALDKVAASHHLSRANVAPSSTATRFEYTFNGRRTHSIEIVTQAAVPTPRPVSADRPALAIIIDDLGYDEPAADSVLALPFRLTVAVLPNHPLSARIAQQAQRRGDQVILHFPMEPLANSPANDTGEEADELRVGMNAQQVDETLQQMLATVPDAVGANNHQGSRATADPALMDAVMQSLHRRNFFFIDSRTTVQTVAYETAERDGVRAAYRRVFLDDVQTPEAVRRQLDLAVHDAEKDGWAIAIGHPHPTTISVLSKTLPGIESRGIRLVFASDLAH